jgi:L-asparaginase
MSGRFAAPLRLGQYFLAACLVAAIAALPGPFGRAGARSAEQPEGRPRIAVFSGQTATIHNSPPLVTSNKARERYGLPLLTNPDGTPNPFDALRLQRLAAPVTVYVEQFSAHPLERDAAELYGPPDGYLDAAGVFHREPQGPDDRPVYEVTLRPEDGPYPLPYMARQANGQAWDDDCASPFAPAPLCRQPFYPDASRIFAEIDRTGVGENGRGSVLSSQADFDFYRAAPPGGYKRGLPEAARTDVGSGDIPPELLGTDFFPYRPFQFGTTPPMPTLARLTNVVQRALAGGGYTGAIWLEGSPTVVETSYWLSILIDTTIPIVGNAAQRPHGQLSADGDRNIVESVEYILSRIWADDAGRNKVGGVVLQDQMVFSAREVQKGDARPGGYVATGGHGGVVASMGDPSPPALTFQPVRRHTFTSAVNMSQLPSSVTGVQRDGGGLVPVAVPIKDAVGNLLPTAIAKVTIAKDGSYIADTFSFETDREVDIVAQIEKNLGDAPLAGFVGEGLAPYGTMNAPSRDRALERAAYSGMPVVKVGRGNNDGFTPPRPPFIGGNNLTATKARLLLMAGLMKFGSLPPAADPDNPTPAERVATRARVAEYQALFDTH